MILCFHPDIPQCLDSVGGNGALKLIDKQGNVIKTFAWENDFGIVHRMPVMIINHSISNNYLYVSSQLYRDTRALVQIDIENLMEKQLIENPEFDIEDVFMDQSGKPFAAVIHPDYPQLCFIDTTVKNEWESVAPPHPFGAQWLSDDKNGKFATMRIYTDTSSQFYLWDKKANNMKVLSCPVLLYYGKNDPLINYASQAIPFINKLEKTNRNVKYFIAGNEGHGIVHSNNILRFQRLQEKFLAEWLGGKNAGFDLFELGYILFWL